MTKRYMQDLYDYAESDIIIVGAGSSGLSAAYELSKYPEIKVALIEQGVAPGGGAWLGGQLFSSMIIRRPGEAFLQELGVPYEEEGEEMVVVKHAALLTSTLLSKVLAAPNIKLFNATAVEDLIIKYDEGENGTRGRPRVAGAVTNWTLVSLNHDTQMCMDPNVLESKVMISCTGHDGPMGASGVKRLAKLGLLPHPLPGMAALDMTTSEDMVVAETKEIIDGMVLCGMEVSEMYGCPRMGPTFGAMLYSGRKAAHVAMNSLRRRKMMEMGGGEKKEEAGEKEMVGAK
jgi:cysteine-dependent adenosine diphosphate thiazole synthase